MVRWTAVSFNILLQTWLKYNSTHVNYKSLYLDCYKLYVEQCQYLLAPDKSKVKVVVARLITLSSVMKLIFWTVAAKIT